MAYLNEFPHTEASKLNLDWLLEQYSTFNQRLAEIVQHFDESVQEMESDILQFKGEYETAFNNFKNDITSLVNEYNKKVDSINENIGGYVNEYLTENINVILEDNPVLETKYEKIGYIDTHESVEYTLETDVIYEIMTIDYALNMHKGVAVNNACNLTQVPYARAEVVADVALTGSGEVGDPYELDVNEEYVLPDEGTVELYTNNNVLKVYNGGTNRIRVYIKPIATL